MKQGLFYDIEPCMTTNHGTFYVKLWSHSDSKGLCRLYSHPYPSPNDNFQQQTGWVLRNPPKALIRVWRQIFSAAELLGENPNLI